MVKTSTFFVFVFIVLCSNAKTVFIDNFNGSPSSYNPDAGTGFWTYFPTHVGFTNITTTTQKGSHVSVTVDFSESNYPASVISEQANVGKYLVAGDLNNPFVIEQGKTINFEWIVGVDVISNSNPWASFGVDDFDMRRSHLELLMIDVLNGQIVGFYVTKNQIFVTQDSTSITGADVKDYLTNKLVAEKYDEEINSLKVSIERSTGIAKFFVDGQLVETAIISEPAFEIAAFLNTTAPPPPYQFDHFIFLPVMAIYQFPDTVNTDPSTSPSFPNAMFPTTNDFSRYEVPAAGQFNLPGFECFDEYNNIITDPFVKAASCPLLEGNVLTAEFYKFKVTIK